MWEWGRSRHSLSAAGCAAALAAFAVAAPSGDIPGDLNGDDVVGLQDLTILILNWGTCCTGDLNRNGIVDAPDFAILFCHWGTGQIPPGTMGYSLVSVDNSAADGDGAFQAGTTYFTFDLRVATSELSRWSCGDIVFAITEPSVQFFLHPFGFDGPPNPAFFPSFPSLEFHSYFCRPTAIGPGQSGGDPVFLPGSALTIPALLDVGWCAGDPATSAPAGTIVRFTIIVTDGSGRSAAVVPAGLAGGAPIVGTITGTSTATGSCELPLPLAFEIVLDGPSFDAPLVFDAAGEPVVEAIGDVDGDGAPDIVAVIPDLDPQTPGEIEVFLNQGDVEGARWAGLVSAGTAAAGDDPSGVTLGFFDGDEHLDAALTNAAEDSVFIYLNDGLGQGTFQTPIVIPVGDAPSSIASGDFNEDGFADLAVAQAGDDSVLILEGDGLGGFVTAQVIIVGLAPWSVTPEDVDNDKCEDLVTSNAGDGTLSIIINEGGTFGEALSVPVGEGPLDVTSGDLDGDGFADLASADSLDDTVSVVLNNGDGTFATAVALPVGDVPRSIGAIFADCDDDLDLAVVADDPKAGPSVQVLVNMGQAAGEVSFAPPVAFPVNGDPNFVVAGTLDGDPDLDLVTVNADDNQSGGSLSALLNNSLCTCPADSSGDAEVGVLDLVEVILSWGPCLPPCAADVNGDGIVNVSDLTAVIVGWGNCQ